MSASANPAADAEPVKRLRLFRCACRTAVADIRSYQGRRRPLSWRRVWRLIRPDLTRPIFVVGAPRSGTTFLGKCLGRIPEVSYHFEPIATKAAARYVYDGLWGPARATWFYRTVYAWLMRLHADGDLRFSEKTPRNSFLIPFLYRAFPDAQFVHIIRDGRDAALSWSQKPWLQGRERASGRYESGGYRYGPYARFWVEPGRIDEFEHTSDVHRCIWGWRRHIEAVLEAAPRLPSGQYHELRYEKLVTCPREEADRLLRFLDIRRPVSCGYFREALGKVRADSVGRWRQDLSDDQIRQTEAEAGPLLRRLGYSN